MTSPPEHHRPRFGLRRGIGAVFISIGLTLAVFCGYMFWASNAAGDRSSAQILELASEELAQSPRTGGSSAVAAGGQRFGGSNPGANTVTAPGSNSDSGADTDTVTTNTNATTNADSPAEQAARQPGDLIGVVSIPSIDAEVAVMEGIDDRVLDQGVLGHYPGTAAPGGVGNFAVAGHRTTHGAPLADIDDIDMGDPIVVETSQGWDVYTMQRRKIVSPETTAVIAPVPDQPEAIPSARWMVLTSCHPKLSAAERMVAYATLDRHVPRDDGPPAELTGA